MGKLERLALLARRRNMFDDPAVEIGELTYIIKADLSAINSSISDLQAFVRQQQQQSSGGVSTAQAEHSKNVVVMLQGKLADVSVGFKEVLEVRTKNIQATKARTEQFVGSVKSSGLDPRAGLAGSHSPLYSNTPEPDRRGDLLSLHPESHGAGGNMQQLALMEQGGQSSYISARGEAIEAIEKTITELGSIFGQLAEMVSQQHDMVQRIDHDTEDVVANVEGAQTELMKYWRSVSSNRWLVAKMFGVLMIFFLLWVLVS
ncbi:t-SNARE [Ascodesmis nigricans]|uniref:t-SNARE n=1 Tax=Ascodesmis nigricans TaxID=341454 RepID=A0A4S2N6K4_9PEZI|nr:t-SNARE [Ascodesmis nigricans]